MSKKRQGQPRAVITRQIELPTPLQQIKMDSLMVRLWRAGREVYSIKSDEEIPAHLRRKDKPAALMVIYKGHPEGIIYLDADGRSIEGAAHKGLHDLMAENARAGEWAFGGPEDYYESLRQKHGQEPDRKDIEALHREYGWIN